MVSNTPNTQDITDEEKVSQPKDSREHSSEYKEASEKEGTKNWFKWFREFFDNLDDTEQIEAGFQNYLQESNIKIADLLDYKIGINQIINIRTNKRNLPNDTEKKIIKLYLEKLYEWQSIDVIKELNEAFNIEIDPDEKIYPNDDDVYDGRKNYDELPQKYESKNFKNAILSEIDKKTISFDDISIGIQKLQPTTMDKIKNIDLSNYEIFKICGLNKSTFNSLEPSEQQAMTKILLLEMNDFVDNLNSKAKDVEQKTRKIFSPTSTAGSFFDKIKERDPEVWKLMAQKSMLDGLENLLSPEEDDEPNGKLQLIEYITWCKNRSKEAGIDEKFISDLWNLSPKINHKNHKKIIRNFCEQRRKTISEKIWGSYKKNFEEMKLSEEFIHVMEKVVLWLNFDYSALNKKEKTILWSTIMTDDIDKACEWIDVGVDSNDFKKFLQDLYDFEKEEIQFNVKTKWDVKLKITREENKQKTKNFSDVESEQDTDILNSPNFIVNIDGNTARIIEDFEFEWDNENRNILRDVGIMETHETANWPMNIWNWYKLEIRGKIITKIITKKDLDDLFNCDNDMEGLEKKLTNLWLWEELKDKVNKKRQELFNPQDVYNNLDENWFDDGSKGDGWYTQYWYKYCIFKEVLKDLDVTIIERNLIFDDKNVDVLSNLYLMAKNYPWDILSSKQNIENTIGKQLWEYSKIDDESAWKEKAKEIAEQINTNMESIEDGSSDDIGDIINENIIDENIKQSIKDYWENLSDEWKTAFEEALIDNVKEIESLNTNFDNEISTALTNYFDELRKVNDSEWNDDEVQHYEPLEAPKTEAELFLEAREKLPWDPKCEFKKWNRMYFDLWESQLPPKDNPSYYCFEIVDDWWENGTKFTIKAIWWELQSGIDGKTYTLDKTWKQLKSMLSSWNIYKVSNKWDDRDSCLSSIHESKITNEQNTFGNNDGEIQLEWDHFVKTTKINWKVQKVTIKYFHNRVDEAINQNNTAGLGRSIQGIKVDKYEVVKVNPDKKTVKVVSNFDDHDDKWEPVRYKYENELTFEQFILLVEWKHLIWVTETEQKDLESRYNINDPGRLASKWIRHRVSVWAFINVCKNATKSIKGKLDANQKTQEEVLENYWFSKEWLNLWQRAEGFLRPLWFYRAANACGELYHEYYTNRENRTRKEIEKYYKIFQSEPNFSEYFKNTLVHILQTPWDISKLDADTRHKFAAAFLIVVKKEWPYSRFFTGYLWKWIWVGKFLWPEHQRKFQDYYKKKKLEIEQEKKLWNKEDVILRLQEELNRMEIDYIVNCIDWVEPYGIDENEYMLKSIRWLKFMEELQNNYAGYFDKHEESKKKLKTFYAAEEQYLRTIKDGRFSKVLPALEAMCERAKSPDEAFRIKGYMLVSMLMWIILNHSSKDTILSFYDTARSMWFAAWSWVEDVDQQKKVKILLDGITNWEFSKKTGYNIWDYEPWDLKDSKYKFVGKFVDYRKANWRNVLKKMENLSYKDEENPEDKSIMDLANDGDNPDNRCFKEFIKHSRTNDYDKINPEVWPIYVTVAPWSGTSNILRKFIPNKWNFSNLKEEKEKKDVEKFWVKAASIIPVTRQNKEVANDKFMLFFNRFDSILGSDIKENIVRSVPLIKKEIKEHPQIARYMIRYMIKWNMHKETNWSFPAEFDRVMDNFVDFFYNNIEFIDEDTINMTFVNKWDNYIRAYKKWFYMLNREQYKKYKMTTLKNSLWWETGRYKNLISLTIDILNQENWNTSDLDEEDFINKKIEEIWKSCNKYNVQPEGVQINGEDNGILLNMDFTSDDIKKKHDPRLPNT